MTANEQKPEPPGANEHEPHPVPNTAETVDFLTKMIPGGPWPLVAIRPDGKVTAKTFLSNQTVQMAAWIDARQGEQNLYFHVNALKRGVSDVKAKKADVALALFLHVDVDDPTALDKIAAFKPKPTAGVFSGGGYQLFWRLEKPSDDLEAVERVNASLAKNLGGDNCHNIDRIMRLPGTINVPNAKKRKAGRRPALAYVVEEFIDWSRSYPLSAFPQLGAPGGEVALASSDGEVRPVGVDELPAGLSDFTRQLIVHGDDPQAPIGGTGSTYPSRSEVVYRVTCDLVRAGCDNRTIVGVLINPQNGISASVLEKRKPLDYAIKQVASARAAVSEGWPDVNRSGKPQSTLRNTLLAIRRLRLICDYDEFHRRKSIGGHALQSFVGELSDDGCAMLRHLILTEFKFDPGKDHSREAANILCLENTYHPVRDYLDGLTWDLKPRIRTWLVTYMGVENTALNQEISKIMLVAAVRRVRKPGVKFDVIVVLEGAQGTGKSTALRILAGDKNFSDQDILTLDPKAQIEVMEGVWIYELCELEGLSRADTNKVKAFASRGVDRARAVYARYREDRPRQNIFVGTTNDDQYLRDLTGNRRFWPVHTATIDLVGLKRDRDQLWAEAAYWEAKDESIELPQELWAAAGREQEARVEYDPWMDVLAKVKGQQVGEFERVSTSNLFAICLMMDANHLQQYHSKRLAQVMRKLGWEGPKLMKMPDGSTQRGYQRKGVVDEEF